MSSRGLVSVFTIEYLKVGAPQAISGWQSLAEFRKALCSVSGLQLEDTALKESRCGDARGKGETLQAALPIQTGCVCQLGDFPKPQARGLY